MHDSIRIILGAMKDDKRQIETYTEEQWHEVFQEARKHELHPFIFDYYDPLWPETFKQSDLYAFWQQNYLEEVFAQKVVTKDTTEILKAMDQQHVPYALLKGTTIARLYKNPAVRMMFDTDLLIDKKYQERVNHLLIGRGYEVTETSVKDVTYSHKDHISIEVHTTIIDGVDRDKADWLTERCMAGRILGDDHIWQLGVDEGLTYLIAHSVKHLYHEGFGLKNLYDIYLYMDHYRHHIDYKEVEESLKTIGMLKGGLYIMALCHRHLGLDFQHGYKIDENYLKMVFDKVVLSGNHGHSEENALNHIYHQGPVQGEAVAQGPSKRQLLFPSLETMSGHYSVLSKRPFLLPLFWGVRLLKTLIFQRQRLKVFAEHQRSGVEVLDESSLIDFMQDDQDLEKARA